MTRHAILSIALLAAAPAVAQQNAQPATNEATEAPTPRLQNLLQNCDAHKFETVVESVVDGMPHRSKVKMCGNEGQSDAEWIRSLEDSIEKLKANKEMAAASRDQIIDAIKAEIARLKGKTSLDVDNGALPPLRSANRPAKPLSDDYTLLPPLPKGSPPPPQLVKPRVEPAHGQSGTATTQVADTAAAPAAPAPVVPPPPKPAAMPNPGLKFACINPDYPGGGPCITLSRDTIVTVKAPQAVSNSVSLRFVRGGDARAELELGSMRKGQTVRVSFPQMVCRGVVTSAVELEVVAGGQVLDRQGPYLLRC
jgi:hypothetical protein